MIIADCGLIERVEMQVAMAFGASVHQLTVMVPSVSATVATRAGLESNFNKKSSRVTVICILFQYFFIYKIFYLDLNTKIQYYYTDFVEKIQPK